MNFSPRAVLVAIVILLLPSPVLPPMLRLLGHRIGRRARIGFTVLLADRILLASYARIGHFNIIRVRRFVARDHASVGRGNLINGPLSVSLATSAAIGNRNRILRAPSGIVTVGPATLSLGTLSKLTSDHRIDCTCSVSVGNYSIIAGSASQLWTHGYVHDTEGPGRYRIDGTISIGDNVYLGSSSVVTAGVTIGNGITIGAASAVARSITHPGLYVSAPLRVLERPAPPDERSDLRQITSVQLCERVYRKRHR